jgi:hypothetical protein
MGSGKFMLAILSRRGGGALGSSPAPAGGSGGHSMAGTATDRFRHAQANIATETAMTMQ